MVRPRTVRALLRELRPEPTELGAGSLTDDFLDIHHDLKGGLSLFDAGHEAAAVWEWRTSFDEHWGRHAVSALHRACR
ncbi:MAG: hypothetical protein SangKO_080640 [Sandaracinaceae bacterium]